MNTLKDKMKKLSHDRQRRVRMRATQLIGEEMTRRELRIALRRTQVAVARELGISQDRVSRLERRTDLLLSTLQAYVRALGGDLSLIVEFPNGEPVKLCGIAENLCTADRDCHKRNFAHA
jgi:transcriptional regulator with XRE-family HTH domain